MTEHSTELLNTALPTAMAAFSPKSWRWGMTRSMTSLLLGPDKGQHSIRDVCPRPEKTPGGIEGMSNYTDNRRNCRLGDETHHIYWISSHENAKQTEGKLTAIQYTLAPHVPPILYFWEWCHACIMSSVRHAITTSDKRLLVFPTGWPR